MNGASAPRLGVAGRMAALFQANAITPLLALVALLLGLFAVLVTPREEEPQINVTMANVIIAWPGASSQDVQAKVALPAEQVLSQIAGIEHTYSVSRPGVAVVTVQFKVGVARIDALVRLYDVLNANQDWLPPGLGVLTPIVRPKGIDDVPVLGVTLHGQEPTSAEALERVARALETELKRVPGARTVQTLGGPGRAVYVWLDPRRLRERGIDLMGLRNALSGANGSMPAGSVIEAGALLQVQTGEFLQSADDVAGLVVGTSNGRPVYLHEVARVEESAQLPSRYVWHQPGKGAGESQAVGQVYPAITLALTKKPGENAVDVTARVRERLDALRGSLIPEDMRVEITRDYGQTAAEKANKLIQKLAFATGSVIVLVGLALGRREAVIVGAAVILTLTATLFASWAWGFTLNRVSLFALIFSIGILVDDAIVVVENIHRHQALTPGKPLAEIIPAAVDEVGGPTILATLTVIAALLPMAFVSGLMGPYMGPIPINSSLGMAISLFIAFSVTPWLARALMREGHAGPESPADSRATRFFGRVLAPFLRSGRRRWALLAGILAALALALMLAAFPNARLGVVLKMLPFDNKSEFQVVLDMPAGTPLEDTAAALQALSGHLAGQPEVVAVQGYVGTASPITFNGLVRQYDLRELPEQGDLQVTLVDKHHRHEQSHAIAQRLRPGLEKLAQGFGARVSVVEVPPGPPVQAPIVAEVYGPDEAGRQALAARLTRAFADTAGIVGVDNTLKADAPRAFLRVNRVRAESLGIPVATIAQTLAAALSGQDATYLHDGHDKRATPVRVQLPLEAQAGLDALLAMPLRAASGALVPLSELVRVDKGVIDKPLYTKDLLALSAVTGDVGGGAGAPLPDSPLYGLFAIRDRLPQAALQGTGDIDEHWFKAPRDAWRHYAIKWDGEWQITYETFRDMGAAYAVGLVMIYLLVVAQFKSYVTPLIIMAPIPLTVIGVMPGHALLGAPFTATSMIGMIALAGIIVRNSILLVDFIELQTARGLPLAEAVLQSASVRAQPILLTGLAAMIGAFFILDDPIFNGLAIALIFGILVSTLLTLVVIPVLYFAWRRAPGGSVVTLHSTNSTEGASP